uniref:Polymerase (DNA directed), gamma 2, accessory subunit n=1 Tax=Eptatretus burgeri TaxID=7764 RepID=A0A8C4NIW2_EPTBU
MRWLRHLYDARHSGGMPPRLVPTWASFGASAAAEMDPPTFWALCRARHFVYPPKVVSAAPLSHFGPGGYTFGPLGVDLRRNLANAWWKAEMTSREQVFGVETPTLVSGAENSSQQALGNLGKESGEGAALFNPDRGFHPRSSLFPGILQHYAMIMELTNRKLPFGLAEIGCCWKQNTGGNMRLMKCLHTATYTAGQGRDGRRSIIPHVISTTASLNQGTLALLLDACQPRSLLNRSVLRMHPWLAPVKIAVDLVSNPLLELKQLCEGLYRELLDAGLTVWPAYLNTEHLDIEQLFMRHDEMGIVFTVLVSDVTLENGTVRLRYRNTGIEEIMHLTLLTPYVQKYIEKS